MSYSLRNIEWPADESLIRGWLSQSRISEWWGPEDEGFAYLQERAAAQQAALLQETTAHTAIGCVCWQRLEPEDRTLIGLPAGFPAAIDLDLFIGDEQYTRRGAGTAMLRLALARIAADLREAMQPGFHAGLPDVAIACSALENQPAIRLAKRCGFQAVREFIDTDEERTPTLCLSRELPALDREGD